MFYFIFHFFYKDTFNVLSSAGGPFKSIIIYDSNKKRVYYLEGYVYAPGSKKRNLMQEISSILMTFEIWFHL